MGTRGLIKRGIGGPQIIATVFHRLSYQAMASNRTRVSLNVVCDDKMGFNLDAIVPMCASPKTSTEKPALGSRSPTNSVHCCLKLLLEIENATV